VIVHSRCGQFSGGKGAGREIWVRGGCIRQRAGGGSADPLGWAVGTLELGMGSLDRLERAEEAVIPRV